ncbi:EF-hand domain pair [Phytophthora cactorum]|nr:EF-hand domain pair [Phytophthora cactorum]
MDSALLPHSNSGDEDTISIVAYGATPPHSERSRPAVESRNSWSPPSDIQTNYQPPDWNSDDGSIVDGSARRIAINARTNSSRSSSSDEILPPPSPPLPANTTVANTTVRPLTLYGKDILHIFPFGTTSQDGNPVKWSDTLGAIDTEDDYSIRDPHFDLTNGKISKLFSLSNPDEKGMLSYEGFRCGLEAMGIACDSDRQFQAFVDVVDGDRNGVISSVHKPESPVTLGSIEYSPDRIRSVYPINQVKSFIYSTNPSWANIHWGQTSSDPICATGRRLAFRQMSMTELEMRLKELDIGRVMSLPRQLSLYVMEGVLISVQGENMLWSALKQRLHVSYSKVRQHSTAFLMYTIMDVCVNELSPISQTFGAKLIMLERLMSLDSRYFDLRRIATCSKQIKGLQMHCKPMREVISKLITSDDYQGETLQYFADVQEHLTTIEEECVHNLDRCDSLVEEFNNARASQQNDVSYILALIAAIFLPAQFLTGVYGMNFPYIPEQTYYYGYFIWWAIMIAVAGLIVLFFKYKRWL